MARITVDPITRIEGHLRIDCEINNGKVIILSVDQLHSHSEYRKACIAQANESPRPIAPAIWADMVDNLLKNMHEDDFIRLPT